MLPTTTVARPYYYAHTKGGGIRINAASAGTSGSEVTVRVSSPGLEGATLVIPLLGGEEPQEWWCQSGVQL